LTTVQLSFGGSEHGSEKSNSGPVGMDTLPLNSCAYVLEAGLFKKRESNQQNGLVEQGKTGH
jgi:hypothetical protein